MTLFKSIRDRLRRWRYREGRTLSRFIARDIRREILIVSAARVEEGIITGRGRTAELTDAGFAVAKRTRTNSTPQRTRRDRPGDGPPTRPARRRAPLFGGGSSLIPHITGSSMTRLETTCAAVFVVANMLVPVFFVELFP